MAYVCKVCGLVTNVPKRYCVRCKTPAPKPTNQPFGKDHDFSSADDGVPPPPQNTSDYNQDEPIA